MGGGYLGFLLVLALVLAAAGFAGHLVLGVPNQPPGLHRSALSQLLSARGNKKEERKRKRK